MKKPRSMPEFSAIHSVTLNQEAKLALSAASAKWPDLADGSIQQLILEVIRDWEQWANVNRGKEALVLYECAKTTHLVERFANHVGFPANEADMLPYRDWCEKYRKNTTEFHIMPRETPLKPSDVAAKYTIRLTPDSKRVLAFAYNEPGCMANSVSALIRWIICDWAKWDLAYNGKTMLKLYEQYKVRRLIAHITKRIQFDSSTEVFFKFDEWAEDYRARRDDELSYREKPQASD